MTRFTDRVTRDLHQIADRSTPSSTAWESIRTRIDEQSDQPTTEVIMLSPDRNDSPKRGWMLAAAAVAGLALIGGLVFATNRSDDDTVPVDTPEVTVPVEPAPDAQVDPDAEAVVVPVPEPTTAAEVTPEPEPEPPAEPVSVSVTGTFSDSGVMEADVKGQPGYQGTTTFAGEMVGDAPWTSRSWTLPDATTIIGAGDFEFSGTIEGLGTGTLSFTDEQRTVDGVWTSTGWISSGTGDFEGAIGTVEFVADPASPDLTAGTGTYSFDITVPPAQSLVSTTVTGQYYEGSSGPPVAADGSAVYSGTITFEGSVGGSSAVDGTIWVLDDRNQVARATNAFRGTIEGIGEGTMTFRETWTKTGEFYDPATAVITGGSGDFEGISGTIDWFPGSGPTGGRYEMTVTAPVADS